MKKGKRLGTVVFKTNKEKVQTVRTDHRFRTTFKHTFVEHKNINGSSYIPAAALPDAHPLY